MINTHTLIEIARAVGEANRLRMLQLCRGQRVAVSEFAEVLGISEPSVSRHIKLLEDVALVLRARQGQRVYFRAVSSGDVAVAAGQLLDQLDPAQPELLADRQRLAALRGLAIGAATDGVSLSASTKLGRALAASVSAEIGSGADPARISVLRSRQPALLQPLLGLSATLQIVADDVAQRGALQRWLLAQDSGAPARVRIVERRSARPAVHCDVVLLDCSDAGAPAINDLLRQAASELAPSGRLWLFVGYDALEAGAGGEHPLLRLRRLLADAGLQGERLQPIEVDGAHILFSVSVPAAQSLRAAG